VPRLKTLLQQSPYLSRKMWWAPKSSLQHTFLGLHTFSSRQAPSLSLPAPLLCEPLLDLLLQPFDLLLSRSICSLATRPPRSSTSASRMCEPAQSSLHSSLLPLAKPLPTVTPLAPACGLPMVAARHGLPHSRASPPVMRASLVLGSTRICRLPLHGRR
jgi:hypothetical protein